MGNPDHILVVDDDLGLRELLDRYFAGNGYRVTTVANGRQMREVLANHRIDLIVLDLMLPGDDGLTLCRNLRANQPYDIPILMLTARGDEADRIVGLEMGADDYLTKPFAPRELLARIRSVLRRAEMLPRNLAASEKARLLSVRRMEARYGRAFPGRRRRDRGLVERRRISIVARVSRSPSTCPQSRSTARPDARP